MARKPRWIAALVLALGIAASFAALGQWQLERSFEGGEVTEEQTETPVPLTEIAAPQQPMPSATIGQRVTVELSFVAGDYLVLSDRINHDDAGYWVIGHGIVEQTGATLTVALGWAATEAEAQNAIDELRASPIGGDVDGRYLMTESPDQQDFEAGERTVVAVSEFINLWSQAPDGVYAGYLVLEDAPAGLTAIDSPPPVTEVSLNLLNVFYAIEWVIFAGFAFYLWYRLVMDAVEAEDAEAATVE
jgi:cytochrome oxidase assembly protein ShyY1